MKPSNILMGLLVSLSSVYALPLAEKKADETFTITPLGQRFAAIAENKLNELSGNREIVRTSEEVVQQFLQSAVGELLEEMAESGDITMGESKIYRQESDYLVKQLFAEHPDVDYERFAYWIRELESIEHTHIDHGAVEKRQSLFDGKSLLDGKNLLEGKSLCTIL